MSIQFFIENSGKQEKPHAFYCICYRTENESARAWKLSPIPLNVSLTSIDADFCESDGEACKSVSVQRYGKDKKELT